jgi:hypothetical protein
MNPTRLREVNGPTMKVSELEGDDPEENLKGLRAETVFDKLFGRRQSKTGLLDTMASQVERSGGRKRWLKIRPNDERR